MRLSVFFRLLPSPQFRGERGVPTEAQDVARADFSEGHVFDGVSVGDAGCDEFLPLGVELLALYVRFGQD